MILWVRDFAAADLVGRGNNPTLRKPRKPKVVRNANQSRSSESVRSNAVTSADCSGARYPSSPRPVAQTHSESNSGTPRSQVVKGIEDCLSRGSVVCGHGRGDCTCDSPMPPFFLFRNPCSLSVGHGSLKTSISPAMKPNSPETLNREFESNPLRHPVARRPCAPGCSVVWREGSLTSVAAGFYPRLFPQIIDPGRIHPRRTRPGHVHVPAAETPGMRAMKAEARDRKSPDGSGPGLA